VGRKNLLGGTQKKEGKDLPVDRKRENERTRGVKYLTEGSFSENYIVPTALINMKIMDLEE